VLDRLQRLSHTTEQIDQRLRQSERAGAIRAQIRPERQARVVVDHARDLADIRKELGADLSPAEQEAIRAEEFARTEEDDELRREAAREARDFYDPAQRDGFDSKR